MKKSPSGKKVSAKPAQGGKAAAAKLASSKKPVAAKLAPSKKAAAKLAPSKKAAAKLAPSKKAVAKAATRPTGPAKVTSNKTKKLPAPVKKAPIKSSAAKAPAKKSPARPPAPHAGKSSGVKPKPARRAEPMKANIPPSRPAKPVKEIAVSMPEKVKAAPPRTDGEDAKRKRRYTRRSPRKEQMVVLTPKYQGKQAIPTAKKPDLVVQQLSRKKHAAYSQKDLEFFRKIILDKIKDANDELVSIEERLMDAATGDFHDEDATYSLHMADQGTDAMEREKAFLFAQRERKFISHLSDALQRINSGNYGVCISCGNLIDKGRLEAVPHARMCINCKNLTKSEF